MFQPNEFNEEDLNEDSPNYKLKQALIEFGLTPNEAKIYIYLVKKDGKRAIEISRSTNIARTETYHLLSGLQNKGLVTATFYHPIRFNAISFDKALELLISIHEGKIRNLERKKEEILTLADLLVDLKTYDGVSKKQNFQILKGQMRIVSKAKDMLSRTKQEFLVLGDYIDHLKPYQCDFIDAVKRSIDAGIDVEFLTLLQHSFKVFDKVSLERVRQIPNGAVIKSCFLLMDRSELLFYVSDREVLSKYKIAMWTDFTHLVNTEHLLFRKLWNDSVQLQRKAEEHLFSSDKACLGNWGE